MTFVSANLTGERQIAAYPYVVTTVDAAAIAFLKGLMVGHPDFSDRIDTKVDWAVEATGGASVGGSLAPGSVYVVSAQTYKRLKAHRY